MSSHKGPAVAQGNGAPASNRAADTVELAELGPLLEDKGKRAVTSPTKVSHLPGQPLLRPVGLPRAKHPGLSVLTEGRKQSAQIRPGSIYHRKSLPLQPAGRLVGGAGAAPGCCGGCTWLLYLILQSPQGVEAGREGPVPGGTWQGLIYNQVGFLFCLSKTPVASPL